MTLSVRAPARAAFLLILAALAACSARRAGPAPWTGSLDARMERIYDLLKRDRLEEADAGLRSVLRVDPVHRQARTELAYLDLRFKKWQEAINLLDALIEEQPDDMRLRMDRGYAREAMGDFSAAADDFVIVARDPGEFQAQALSALDGLAAESTPEAKRARAENLLNEGYDDLRLGRKTAAREKFKSALVEEPDRLEIQKQLGYMSVDDGDLAAAAKDFAGVHELEPDDYEAALELGYLYDSLHDEAGAEKAFAAALPSRDEEIHESAAAALREIRGARQPLYLDVYASPFYTSRFSDKVAFVEANLGYRPDPKGAFSFYLATRYTEDSRSRAGTIPELFSDNALSVGPGVRIQPHGYNASLSIEWGEAWNLTRGGEHPRAFESNTRVMLGDYRYWTGPAKLFADAGGSLGYYSRYRDDVIGYVQLRAGIGVWGRRTPRLSLYVPVNVVKDTNRDFFNNVGEAGGGAELQPWRRRSLRLRAEYLRGAYMGIQGRDPNPYGRAYTDIRLTLIYSAHFAKVTEDEDRYRPYPRPRFKW